MSTPKKPQTLSNNGADFRFVALDEAQAAQPVCLSVVVRVAHANPAASPFVLLRSTANARVYLGAQVDRAGQVREWLEIWVQTLAGLESSMVTQRAYLSNSVLDAKWSLAAQLLCEADGPAYITTGWESEPPCPVYIDVENGRPWHPVDPASGRALRICKDDAALRTAGLPEYTASLHRYLAAAEPSGAGVGPFYPVTPGAPQGAAVRPMACLIPPGVALVAFNPEGGLLMVRRHPPLGLEEYVDLLGGKPWEGVAVGSGSVRPAGLYSELNDWDRMQQGGEHFFLGGCGRPGRFVEGFHLRLQLLSSLVRLTRESVARRKLPMLNLSTESFRVELGHPAPGLPIFWAARVAPVQPGQAVDLPIKTSEMRHFLPLDAAASTIFRPEFLGLPTRGSGTVRIRRVFTDTGDLTSIEGTLVTSERLRLSPHDLLWLKLPLSIGHTDLFANLDTAEGLAQGEARFRTVPQNLAPPLARALREAEGSPFGGTSFETIPMLSTPCDLYALGVLAVRILLVNGTNSLSVALDEVLSLARQLGVEGAAGRTFGGDRVKSLAAEDPRWTASLGAHRLSHQGMTAEDAFNFIPEELWWEVLAAIARFFPGHVPDSYCRDFADVSNFALERVFDGPLVDLDKLLLRSRGLLFSDWRSNNEVAAIIDRLR